jgi:hypothetical protein
VIQIESQALIKNMVPKNPCAVDPDAMHHGPTVAENQLDITKKQKEASEMTCFPDCGKAKIR